MRQVGEDRWERRGGQVGGGWGRRDGEVGGEEKREERRLGGGDGTAGDWVSGRRVGGSWVRRK